MIRSHVVGSHGLEVLRRARGFVPLPLRIDDRRCILATGAQLKSTVALSKGGQVVVSQHLGDLFSPEGVLLHRRTVEDLMRFFGSRPELVACDLHRTTRARTSRRIRRRASPFRSSVSSITMPTWPPAWRSTPFAGPCSGSHGMAPVSGPMVRSGAARPRRRGRRLPTDRTSSTFLAARGGTGDARSAAGRARRAA